MTVPARNPDSLAARLHREHVERRRRFYPPAKTACRPHASPRVKPPAKTATAPTPHLPVVRVKLTDAIGSRPTIGLVIRLCALRFGVEDITGHCRYGPLIRARHVAMYLARVSAHASVLEIGKRFGGFDHTTVVHVCQKYDRLVATDPETAALISELKDDLKDAVLRTRAGLTTTNQ